MLLVERAYYTFFFFLEQRHVLSILASTSSSFYLLLSPFHENTWNLLAKGRSFERSSFDALHLLTLHVSWRSRNAPIKVDVEPGTMERGLEREIVSTDDGRKMGRNWRRSSTTFRRGKMKNPVMRKREKREGREKRLKSSLTGGEFNRIAIQRVCRERCSACCSSSSRNKRARVRIIVVSTSRIYRETRR